MKATPSTALVANSPTYVPSNLELVSGSWPALPPRSKCNWTDWQLHHLADTKLPTMPNL
jgi:hypothetical protein